MLISTSSTIDGSSLSDIGQQTGARRVQRGLFAQNGALEHRGLRILSPPPLALGDDLASALGARVVRTRVFAVLAVMLLAGSATALAGPISFVGLMVPHAVRWIVGPDQRWIIAHSVLAAPVLLLLADVVGRVVMPPGELPAGIVTALIGAPVLIVLVRRRKASEL